MSIKIGSVYLADDAKILGFEDQAGGDRWNYEIEIDVEGRGSVTAGFEDEDEKDDALEQLQGLLINGLKQAPKKSFLIKKYFNEYKEWGWLVIALYIIDLVVFEGKFMKKIKQSIGGDKK